MLLKNVMRCYNAINEINYLKRIAKLSLSFKIKKLKKLKLRMKIFLNLSVINNLFNECRKLKKS